jgi:hypothetical protein
MVLIVSGLFVCWQQVRRIRLRRDLLAEIMKNKNFLIILILNWSHSVDEVYPVCPLYSML